MTTGPEPETPPTWPSLSQLTEAVGGIAVLRVEPRGHGSDPHVFVLAGGLAFNKELGRVIRSQRKARGVTLPELAPLTNLSMPTLSRIERGKYLIKPWALKAIAQALEANADHLIQSAASRLIASQFPHLAGRPLNSATVTFPHLGDAILTFLDRVIELADGDERRTAWDTFRSTAALALGVDVTDRDGEDGAGGVRQPAGSASPGAT